MKKKSCICCLFVHIFILQRHAHYSSRRVNELRTLTFDLNTSFLWRNPVAEEKQTSKGKGSVNSGCLPLTCVINGVTNFRIHWLKLNSQSSESNESSEKLNMAKHCIRHPFLACERACERTLRQKSSLNV